MTLVVDSPGTRAVVRAMEAGSEDICPADHGGCGAIVKFVAQTPSRYRLRVIANVYWRGVWNRTEFWHPPCYVAAGMPYGTPDMNPVLLADLIEVLDMGIEPTSDEVVLELVRRSKARRDPAYRHEAPAVS